MVPRFPVRYGPATGNCAQCGRRATRLVIVNDRTADVVVCDEAWCAAQALARFPLKTATPYEG